MSDQPNKPDSIYNIDEETDSSFEQLFRDDGSQIGYSSESDSEDSISEQSISFSLQDISSHVQQAKKCRLGYSFHFIRPQLDAFTIVLLWSSG